MGGAVLSATVAVPELQVRAFRRRDSPSYSRWLMEEFPEERETVGYRAESMERLIGRAYRPEVRFLLGLLRWFGRPIFSLYFAEWNGQPAGMAFLGFGERSGFIASVVTDPAYRGRGVASAILARAHADLRRFRRRYAVLEVLVRNSGARRLYRKLGYEPIRDLQTYVGAERTEGSSVGSTRIRPWRRDDLPALIRLGERSTPPKVKEAIPVGRSTFALPTGWAAFEGSGSAGWVIERAAAPAGFFRTTFGQLSPVGHLSAPVFGEELGESERRDAVRHAANTLGRQGAKRVICELPEDLLDARTTLLSEGFQPAYGSEQMRYAIPR
ncbi:MAG: GNAT family N-acetyltransferase [Thermoplasmata archaeon]|nr:GNAT family N-acetyltransferase [Thermoplasmata archaeon]